MSFDLASLPNELVELILEKLVPDPLPFGTTSDLNPEFRTRQSTLYNLCLSAKGIQAIAQPLLYRCIALTSKVQIYTLFRTLLTAPRFRRWPRTVAFAWNVKPYEENASLQFLISDIQDVINTVVLTPEQRSFLLELNNKFRWNIRRYFNRGITQSLLAFIVSLSNATALHITLPLWGGRDELGMPDFRTLHYQQYRSLQRAFRALKPTSVLRLRVEGGQVNYGTSAGDFFPCNIFHASELLNSVKLRHLEAFGDYGWWPTPDESESDKDKWWPLSEDPYPGLADIERLSLLDSNTTPSGLAYLFRKCTRLVTVDFTFRQTKWSNHRAPYEYKTLDQALLELPPTIRTLHLTCITLDLSDEWAETSLQDYPYADEYQLVSCLPELQSLTELTIGLILLYGPYQGQHLALEARGLSSKLPRDLQMLVLIEDSLDDACHSHRLHERHDQWLGLLLDDFAQSSAKHLSSLETVIFRAIAHPEHTAAIYGDLRCPTRIAELTEAFRQRGVTFRWETHHQNKNSRIRRVN